MSTLGQEPEVMVSANWIEFCVGGSFLEPQGAKQT
jgi:hypothetical protein